MNPVGLLSYPQMDYQGQGQSQQYQYGGFSSSACSVSQLPPLPIKRSFKKMIREYIHKHKDILFTLFVALLVDHFVLDGALRTRIQRVIEAALQKMEVALGVVNNKEAVVVNEAA